MNGVFNEFFNFELLSKFLRGMEELEDSLTVDRSAMVYVDGEEGDYGTITYTLDGVVIAVREVLGGDCDDIRFTPEGVNVIGAKLSTLFSNTCKEVV